MWCVIATELKFNQKVSKKKPKFNKNNDTQKTSSKMIIKTIRHNSFDNRGLIIRPSYRTEISITIVVFFFQNSLCPG